MGVGTWGTTTLADGRTAGALALPAVDKAVLQRVIDTVNRVRAADLPGVLPVVDLVAHTGRVWLVTSTPASPTVASLAGRLSRPIAATIATNTGQTLLTLHRAGLVHGAFDTSAVTVGPDGTVLLNEVGLAAAVQGTAPDTAVDVAAWTAMVRDLVPGDPILDAVATAAVAGLDTALRVLNATTSALPGYGDRAALLALLAHKPAAHGSDDVPAGSKTLLGRATRAPRRARRHAAPVTPAAEQTTRLGRRPSHAAGSTPVRAAGGEVIRFGPGVPAQASVPTWAAPVAAGGKPHRRRGRRITTILTTVVTLAVVAVAGSALWQRYAHPLQVTGVAVAPTALTRCDSKADVVATVLTNGRAGSFAYEWRVHLDGGTTDDTTTRLEQSVNAGQSTVATHLLWSFSGKGNVTGTATITILSPPTRPASGSITYTCR